MGTQATIQSVSSKEVRPAVSVSIGAWLVAIGLVFLAVFAVRAPNPEPATAPVSDFSAERAMVHVRALASKPHPIGSAANEAAGKYLLEQLSALGFQTQLFEATGIHSGGRGIGIGQVHDLLGRLSGTANSRAIMLMAHYDTVYRAPGAADDSSGVAAILETIRALRASSPLKNDLIVLFTDGEEAGLLGAEAFAASHPWMKDVGMVMNFEARGNKGPSLLFETGPDNGKLIDVVSHSASHPLGSSLFYSLYKLLPNDTDYTVFRRLRVPGLNFAFGENLEAYHSALDTAESLSHASLQHHGANALSLTRALGQMDLVLLANQRGDDIFFDWFGTHLVSYPQSWVFPGEILLTLLLLAAVVLGVRSGSLRKARVFAALLYSVVFVVALPIVAAAAQWLTAWLLGPRMILPDSTANALLLSGLVFLAVATGILLFAAGRKYFTAAELSFGGLLLATILSWGLAYLLPAGSYLLFWPVLVVTIGVLVLQAARASSALTLGVAGLAGAATTILLFGPIIYLIYIFLTLQLITAVCAGLLAGLAFLICGPWVETAAPYTGWRSRFGAVLSASAITIIGGVALSHPGYGHPRRDTLLYGIDADAHKAAWITYDRTLDSWTSQLFPVKPSSREPAPSYLGGSPQPVLSSSAPMLELAAPTAHVESDRKENGLRKIRIKIASPRKAELISLLFGKDSHPLSVTAGGKELNLGGDSKVSYLKLFGTGNQDQELEVVFQEPAKVSFWLSDQSFGLPASVGRRPEGSIAGDGSDIIQVTRKFEL